MKLLFLELILTVSLLQSEAFLVNSYDYGIWRIRRSDGGYEVKDVIVPSPLDKHSLSESSEDRTFTHGSLHGLVERSLLTASKTASTLNFLLNDVLAISVALDQKSEDSPEKVGASVTFHGAVTVYGIPERAVELCLKDGHRYRLWNLDIFKYALDNDQGLYGAVPYLMAHSTTRTVGFVWLNAADTSCTMETVSDGRVAKWQSEGGIADVFLLPGPTPLDVLKQMSYLTGKPHLPPLFALGYHQCRWNYRSEEDTLQVDEGFDTHDIPYDVIWLDIEHTDGKRYFTWDPQNFPNPEQMQEKIALKGRKLVTITDPHIKRAPGYYVFDEATAKGYFIKNAGGASDFEGHCWPGSSSWLDFVNPEVRDWYATLFKYDRYKGSTPILYTWIDMNEPSVFSGTELTMDKNAEHFGGLKHKYVHNQYGFYQAMAAYAGLLLRCQGQPHDTPTRPFVLSRSFFAGVQRYAAVWTGDNEAAWGHLSVATPMLASLSLSGVSFVGADVGGFFGNPDVELLVRWYQAAAFQPFYRGHSHLESKRREPWLFGEDTTRLIRNAIRVRYRILPYLYTLFFQATMEGSSVLSPMFFKWPKDEKLFTMGDQFMLGDALLVKPIANPRSENHDDIPVYLPGTEKWFDFSSGEAHEGSQTHTFKCDMERIPVLQHAGTVLPLRERARRSSTAMRNDPYTLQLAVDSQSRAEGFLYLDDTHSFKYQKGGFLFVEFTLRDGRLHSVPHRGRLPRTTVYTSAIETGESYTTGIWVERIRIFGWKTKVKEIFLEHSEGAEVTADVLGLAGVSADYVKTRQQLEFSQAGGVLTIRKPMASLGLEWTVVIG
eukprot:RCo020398